MKGVEKGRLVAGVEKTGCFDGVVNVECGIENTGGGS